MSDIKTKGVKAFFWDLLGKISNQSLGFIITIILTRVLEPSDFGLIAILMVIIGGAQVFSDVGLASALIQRKKTLSIHYSSVFYFNVFIAFILTIIVFFSAELIASFYKNSDMIVLIKVISFLFIINSLGSVQTVRLRKKLKYDVLTKIGFLSSFLAGIVGITVAFQGGGVWSLVVQIFLQGILTNFILWKVTNWYPSFHFSLKALKQLWSFGLRMFFVELMGVISSRADFLIIGKIFPIATLGYFQRAKSFNNLVVQFTSGSLMSVLFPLLSEIKDDISLFKSVVFKCLNLLVFVVFLLVGCLYLSSEEIIVFLFSSKWLPSVPYVELLILSAFSFPLNSLLVNILASRGNSKSFLKMAVIKKSIFFINLGVSFSWGIETYLIGLIIVSCINICITAYFASKEISVQILTLLRPIAVQMFIALIAVFLTEYIVNILNVNITFNFIFKNSFFIFTFISFNFFLKTDSLSCAFQQALSIYSKLLKRK